MRLFVDASLQDAEVPGPGLEIYLQQIPDSIRCCEGLKCLRRTGPAVAT